MNETVEGPAVEQISRLFVPVLFLGSGLYNRSHETMVRHFDVLPVAFPACNVTVRDGAPK